MVEPLKRQGYPHEGSWRLFHLRTGERGSYHSHTTRLAPHAASGPHWGLYTCTCRFEKMLLPCVALSIYSARVALCSSN